MAIHLGANQYGKAESRVVRIYRDTPRHQIRDLNVSSALRGRFENAHTTGDQSDVLPTDTQKNTAFAFAKEKGVGAIEEFALTLGDQFLSRLTAGRRRPGRDRGVPVGADLRRRRRPRPLLRPQRRRHPYDGRQRRGPRRRAQGTRRLGHPRPDRAQVDRLGVPRLPQGQVHDPAGDRRPDPRDVAGRPLALRPHRRRLGQVVRRDQGSAAGAVRQDPQPRAAADPVRDGRGRSRAAPGGRGDQVLGTQQAPLPGRPDRRSTWRTRARCSSRRTVRTG